MMTVGFRHRRLVTAALTANAIRPLPGFHAGPPAFFAGWLTGELAPQRLAATAVDTAIEVLRGRRDPVALAAAGATLAGLGYLVAGSRKVKEQVEEALVEGLGVDYVEQFDAPPTPAELATPWRKLVNPFNFTDLSV